MGAAGPPYEALTAATYTKSSYSTGAQSCVMTAAVDGWIGVQDSKHYASVPAQSRPTLAFPAARFAAFVHGVSVGEFDDII